MIKNFQIDILTTLIPEVKNDQELEKKNPLLKLLKKKEFKFRIFNRNNEIPKDSKYYEFLSKEYQKIKRDRPLLSDYYKNDLSDWIIISNSDIIFYSNLEEIIEICDQKEIGFATARRFDTENTDFFLKKEFNKSFFEKYLKDYCKFQSKRTLDFFLIKKDIFKSLLILEKGKLIPGTVLFDIYFYLYAKKLTKTADITKECLIIHQNHENFRIASKYNLITSIKENNNFVNKRKINIPEDISYGCLTYSDFYLNKRKMIKKSKSLVQLRYKIESLRIKLINILEVIIYYWNYLIFKINKKFFKKNKFTLRRILGFLILFPVTKIYYSTVPENLMSFKEYMKIKYELYTKIINFV